MSYIVCARVAQCISCKLDDSGGSKDRLLDQVVGRSGVSIWQQHWEWSLQN